MEKFMIAIGKVIEAQVRSEITTGGLFEASLIKGLEAEGIRFALTFKPQMSGAFLKGLLAGLKQRG